MRCMWNWCSNPGTVVVICSRCKRVMGACNGHKELQCASCGSVRELVIYTGVNSVPSDRTDFKEFWIPQYIGKGHE